MKKNLNIDIPEDDEESEVKGEQIQQRSEQKQ